MHREIDPRIFICSHGGKRKRSCFYVCGEIGLLVGSLEDWEHHQVVFSQENGLVQEPPLQHNLLWPTLSGGNIIGLEGN